MVKNKKKSNKKYNTLKKLGLGLSGLIGTYFAIKKGRQYLSKSTSLSAPTPIPVVPIPTPTQTPTVSIPIPQNQEHENTMRKVEQAIRNIKKQIDRSGRLQPLQFQEYEGVAKACSSYNKMIKYFREGCKYAGDGANECFQRRLREYKIDLKELEESAKILHCV